MTSLSVPDWVSEDEFLLGGLRFWSTSDVNAVTTPDRIVLLKMRNFLDDYFRVMDRIRPARVLEFGIWHGGSAFYFAALLKHVRYVGIDIAWSRPVVEQMVKSLGLTEKVALHFKVSQDNESAVRNVIAQEFADSPLDMIIDDASHLYEESRASFETTFGFLKPGGVYAIEDWGWSHWPGFVEPEEFSGKPALSNLVLESILSCASGSGAIANVEIVNHALALIYRGSGLKHGERFDLPSSIRARRRYTPM